MSEDKIYNEHFFKRTKRMEMPSAQAVAHILIKHFHPKSIIDIGCGVGIYLKEFENNNVDIIGFDSAAAALNGSLVGNKIKLHDLCKPLTLNKSFDLCLCIEVAEHLKPECGDILLETLTGLSQNIVFTAATPGQGSEEIGHINEQSHEFWINAFEQMGFALDKESTENIKKEMEDNSVVWWITKNLMIFKKLN